MKYGLSAALEGDTIWILRSIHFSLNMDESSSNNLKKVIYILVRFYSPVQQTSMMHHFTSISLIKADASSILKAVTTLMELKEIPWENLVSVLMDSYNVMRGSKSGFEKLLLQGPAPHLLNVDGAACHHVHNATQQFCQPFHDIIEELQTYIFNEIKWSTDLRDFLQEVCELIGIGFTMP